ncbi:MAG: DsrE family protein [Planctomycetaceae bacterium]|nr:DsrE family protein [Planctomycetales bacterium]MCB9921413.1 DsrE family protein [Planctomycetaceae bacterium]
MRSRIYGTTTLAFVAIATVASWISTSAQEDEKAIRNSESRASANASAFVFPRIKDHGKVVRLPSAAEQPRNGSKICVDVTAGGPAEAMNPAVEKVARFVNIYAGAGDKPADVSITVILHGDATLTALGAEAYATKFGLDGNPNLPLFRKLKEAGVELLVCGQAISHKGISLDDIAVDVKVAVSALTVNVNRQSDGYAFVPLH